MGTRGGEQTGENERSATHLAVGKETPRSYRIDGGTTRYSVVVFQNAA
jgi:hypothetical protein